MSGLLEPSVKIEIEIQSQEKKGEACPVATGDVEVNLENRQKAIDKANYGPRNPNEANADYWREVSKGPGILWSDGIHPSTQGNEVLLQEIVEVLGTAPGAEVGACLESEFIDDGFLFDSPPIAAPIDTEVAGETSSVVPEDSSASTSTSIP